MKFDADIHHRRSIRLKGHDYSSPAAYFITLCAQNRELLFGHMQDVEMFANEAGEMIIEWWKKIPDRFPGSRIDAFVIMPNHMHGIIK